MLDRPEEEHGNVDSHLEAGYQCLARGWHRLEVAVNFSRLQHKAGRSKEEESFAAAKETRDRAFEEAEVADWHREAVEKREQELLAFAAALERQAWERKVIAPAPTKGLSNREVGLRALGEALELVASEQDLERDRLEVMERQVMTAEDALTAETDEGIAGAR